MPTNAELTAQVAELTKAKDKAEGRVATLTSDLASANERADVEAKARADAEAGLDTARGEIASLAKSLKAYKGSATKARNEVTVLKAERSPQSRPIGAMKPAKTDEHAAVRAAALTAAFAEGPVQLVFSDGRREIREIAPLITDDSAFRATAQGRLFNFEPVIEAQGLKGEVVIAGVGLLNEAGDQVGYCRLAEPVKAANAQKVMIPKGSIRF